MINLPKMKVTFVAVVAITSFTCNLAPGWTQPRSQLIAVPLPKPDTGTPKDNRTATPGGTRVDDLPPPPDSGAPDSHRTPGGTRPGGTTACKQTDKPLTALVPENGKALTTAEHPVFWFYIPYAASDVNSIEFSLHDRNDTTTLYRTSLQLTKTPGVIGVPLPPSPEHSLKFNESYKWRLIVNCDRKPTSENVLALDGWVTRVQPSPNQVLWYDELTNLAKRYLSEPQNPEIKKAWIELLKSVGLEGLAQAPVVSSGHAHPLAANLGLEHPYTTA